MNPDHSHGITWLQKHVGCESDIDSGGCSNFGLFLSNNPET